MREVLKKYITGKKVAVLGFGREGKSTLKLIEEIGGYTSVSILDLNEVKSDYEDVAMVCGADYQKNLDDYDVVIKSPGIVLERDFDTYKCKILCQTEIFFERYSKQIIGITGTKGKSTTTALIYHILKESGRDTVLAGNIGIPAFDIIDSIDDNTIIVFEMSSHMLEYMTVAPRIGVFLNIHEEHLDHYGTMEKYVNAKKNIYLNQKSDDICFVNNTIGAECDSELVELYCDFEGEKVSEESLAFVDTYLSVFGNIVNFKHHNNMYKYEIPVEDIRIFGGHNYYDIGVAFGVLSLKGITYEEFDKALKTFESLPHRLQYVGEYNDVKYYDDSISTICDTAIQAMNCVPNIDTILIGGMDRGIDYAELIEYLSDCKLSNIILMYETGQRIFNEINEKYCEFKNKERLVLVNDLVEAVQKAKELTKAKKACVMSPAAASYGYFKNFEERGDVFKELVAKM